jgi:deazaflavin-dependent oxidoreductase (nitroreductase family)
MTTEPAASYRPSFGQRMANRILTGLVGRGKGPAFMRLLTVEGRRTGRPHTTPVVPVEHEGETWLVSPFGSVSWVRNLRAHGRAELRRGSTRTGYLARELDTAEAVPVLREYLSMPSERFVRKDFGITAGSPDEAIAAEAPRHPVFALTAEP